MPMLRGLHALSANRKTRVYPAMRGPANAEDLDILRNNVGHLFVRLQDFVLKMSDRGNGLLIWVI
jgi:hypothetical protein